MDNFKIAFSNPWALYGMIVVLIGLALAFFAHFRIAKKYRRNRNRIVSLVLHIIVLILSGLVLSGMTFNYTVNNDQNEILLLVDVSDSSEEAQDSRDDFVSTVLDYGKYDGYNMGVVTFGFDQVYAVPFTTDVEKIYDRYLAAELPDTSASDIASALNYAKTLFTYPETGKIVLVTDGKETDEKASSVIRTVSAMGIKVDTCYLDTTKNDADSQIMDVQLPDAHISIGETYAIEFSVKSSEVSEITATIYDNGVAKESKSYNCVKGMNSFSIDHIFEEKGFHELSIKISGTKDSMEENNEYRTYLNIENYNKVLILERNENESDNLVQVLSENEAYEPTVINITDETVVPKTVDELRAYDQVLLCNIHITDMPLGFDSLLKSYVEDYGGGVFTVGGNDENGDANAYNRDHMYGTAYQDFLPVQLIDYTPPVGVVFIVDISGSMFMPDEKTGKNLVEIAIAGAKGSLKSLTERDYVGVMTLEDEYGLVLPMTPRSQEAKILTAIDSINGMEGGGTIFFDSIKTASEQLKALDRVDKRHIVLITDGQPGDAVDPETNNPIYEDLIEKIYNEYAITTSVVLLGETEGSEVSTNMERATEKGHGKTIPLTDVSSVESALRDDLSAPEIKEVNLEEFNPVVSDIYSPVFNGIEFDPVGEKKNQLSFTLDGFYGVKVKQSAKLLLVGDYDVPLYAQWNYGLGMVGSFMCDLNGEWSSNMLQSEDGKRLIRNIVGELMPNENIRPSAITVKARTENYITQLSVYPNLQEGEYIVAELTKMGSDGGESVSLNAITELSPAELRVQDCYVSLALDASNNYSRANYVIRNAGVYQLTIKKLNEAGEELASYSTFQSFSYSKEYDVYLEEEILETQAMVQELAQKGRGTMIEDIEDPIVVFEGFVTDINKSFDPRYLFMILAMVLFLLDIAVRKFKFKWIHELIRNRKKK